MVQIEVPDELMVDGKFMGKFADLKAAAESAKAAQQKITEQAAELARLKNAPPPIEIAPPGGNPEDVAQNASKAAKMNLALAKLQVGDVSVIDELAGYGLSRDLLMHQVELAQDSVSKFRKDLGDISGGDDALKEQLRWAVESGKMTRYELTSLQQEMASGNPTRQMNAARALTDRYRAAEGHEAREVIVSVPGGPAKRVSGFGSEAELKKAFADERYINGDEAYIKEVSQRAMLSPFVRQNAAIGDTVD